MYVNRSSTIHIPCAEVVVDPVTDVGDLVEPVAKRVIAKFKDDGIAVDPVTANCDVVDAADDKILDDVAVPAVGVVTAENVSVKIEDVDVTPSVVELTANDAVLNIAVDVLVVATAVETVVSCLVADTENDRVDTTAAVSVLAGDVDVTTSVVEPGGVVAASVVLAVGVVAVSVMPRTLYDSSQFCT